MAKPIPNDLAKYLETVFIELESVNKQTKNGENEIKDYMLTCSLYCFQLENEQ